MQRTPANRCGVFSAENFKLTLNWTRLAERLSKNKRALNIQQSERKSAIGGFARRLTVTILNGKCHFFSP